MRLNSTMIRVITLALPLALLGCQTTQSSSKPSQRQLSYLFQKQQVVPTTNDVYPPKNPQTVAIYTDNQSPLMPYRVIGVATVAHHDFLGIQRQNNTVHDSLKTLAASIGGDALIHLDSSNHETQAHVIAYQKILI